VAWVRHPLFIISLSVEAQPKRIRGSYNGSRSLGVSSLSTTPTGIHCGKSWSQRTRSSVAAQSLACTSAQTGASPASSLLHCSKNCNCTDANRNIPPFEIVLVSRCKEERDTEWYFTDMPWAAMTHDSATGRQGLALMEKYGVSTIPALVLLDGEGALICKFGQDHLRTDFTGKGFPWPAPIAGPRPAQVGFAIPPLAGVRPKKPPGKPPPFPQQRWSTAGLSVGRPVGLPVGRPMGHSDQTTEHAGTPVRHAATILQSPTPATPGSSTRKREHSATVPRPKPPPKPNISVRNPPPPIHPEALAALVGREVQSTFAFTPRRLMEPLPLEPEELEAWNRG